MKISKKRIFCIFMGLLTCATVAVLLYYVLLAAKYLAMEGNPEMFLKEIEVLPKWLHLVAFSGFFLPFIVESRIGIRMIGRSIAR